jgi:molybdate/tungstate transport system ATP-binding protein
MITLRNISVEYADFQLKNVSLKIEAGEFFVLMGPTGAGKTVLLEAIAGLAPLASGEVLLDGRDISTLPPEKRGIGLVYQDYALFPHLTVEQNIRFGLRYSHRRGLAEDGNESSAEAYFHRLTKQLDLEHLLHRKPPTLSGGEAQRAALARALIIRPRLLLLDEPLSALDAAFREEIRKQLRYLHRETGTTFLMVTHDFHDALALGTRAAVIHNGRVEQTGSVREIYRRPASHFVARFVGMGNVLEARIDPSVGIAYAEGLEVVIAPAPREDSGLTRGLQESGFQESGPQDSEPQVSGFRTGETGEEKGTGTSVEKSGFIAIRPEDIVLSRTALESSMRNHFRGRIESIRDYGIACEVRCRVGTTELISHITRGSLLDLELEEGAEVYLSWKATATHIL